jgi:hypothetical protein
MEFLGKGWSFPPSFQKETGGVQLTEGVEDIKESLQILLSTRVGERVMLPSFGCNLDDLVFENVDISLKTYLADLVETAIIEFEPRIDLDGVLINTVNQYEGVVLIEVQFTVRATNSRFNFVYPFYQKEGSDL